MLFSFKEHSHQKPSVVRYSLVVVLATVFCIAMFSSVANAITIKEIKTECGLTDCNTTLDISGSSPELTSMKTFVEPKQIDVKKGSVDKVATSWIGNTLIIRGKILPATQNYIGIKTYWNSTWWNSSYPYRYLINSTSKDIMPISVNDTYGLNSTIYWTLNSSSGEKKYFYCQQQNCSTDLIAIGNETDQTSWERDNTRTGYLTNITWNYLNVVSVWHFGEGAGTSAGDSSGNANTITLSSGVKWNATGVFGSGVRFGGSTATFGATTSNTIDRVARPTITVWFWRNRTGTWDTIIENQHDSGGFFLGVNNADHVRCLGQDASANYQDVSGSTTVGIGLSFVACVINGTHIIVYLNGIQDGIGAFAHDLPTGAGYTCIGATKNAQDDCSDGGGLNLAGTIDEIRIYNAQLTQQQLREMYYNGIRNLTTQGPEEYNPPPTTTTTTTLPNGTTYTYSCSGSFSVENVTTSNSSYFNNILCPFGCNSGNNINCYIGRTPQCDVCNPDPFMIDLEMIGGIFAFIFLIFLLIWAVKKI